MSSFDDTLRRTGDPLIGTNVDGRFEVRGLLGKGGMGAVYLAYQPSVGREVALKVLHGHYQHEDELVKRFQREIHVCAQLNHPNVVTVYDAGVSNGVLFMAMERLQGHSLGDLISHGPVPPARAAALAAQICDALAAAHERGIVHRDIKPSNVMVLDGPGGRELIKVLDFGIATIQSGERLTRTNGVLGSPNAIAPEVLKSAANVSPKADLYAVGTLLYELLTGEPPFGADSANAVFFRQVAESAPPLPETIPSGLRSLVASLTAIDPAKRPANASVVRERLLELAALSTLASTAPAPAAEAPSRRWLVIAAVALVLAGIGGVLAFGHVTPVPPPVKAVAPIDAGVPEPLAVVVEVDAGSSEDAGVELDAGRTAMPVKRRPPTAKPPKRTDYEE